VTRFGIVRLSGAALIALSTAAMIAVGTAGATGSHGKGKSDTEVVSGDDRAEALDGNATTCEDVGLPDATFFDGAYLVDQGYATTDGYKVTIGQLPEDITLVKIVIKGGDAYNVYEPGERGLAADPPYADLRSPDNNGGNLPRISHWFACGTTDTEESPSPTPSETSTCPNGMPGGGDECESPSPTPSETSTCPNGMPGGGDECESPSPTPSATPTVDDASPTPSSGGQVDDATPPPSSGNSGGNLAHTGFNTGLSIGIAGLLLVVGALMLLAPNRLAVAVGRIRRRG
jgi:hypothetical protein